MEESKKQTIHSPPDDADLVADLMALETNLLLDDLEALDALAALEAEFVGEEVDTTVSPSLPDPPVSPPADDGLPDEALLLAEMMAMEELLLEDAPVEEVVADPEPVVAQVVEPEPIVEAVVEPEPVTDPVEVVKTVVEPEPILAEVDVPVAIEEDDEWAEMPASSGLLDEWVADIDRHIAQTQVTLSTPRALPESREQMIIFTMGNTRYAVPIDNVLEIGQAERVTPLPNVPAWLKGITNLRGDILSLVDLGGFMGLNGDGNQSSTRQMLVAKSHEQSMITGLLVDKVNEIRHLSVEQMPDTPPQLGEKAPPFLRGIYQQEEQLLLLLDLEKMLQSPELQQFS